MGATWSMDGYDRDQENIDYEFEFTLNPLNWLQLVIKFAFDRYTFWVLYILLGILSTGVAFAFYLTVRFTTRLETPPRFRFSSMFMIVVPPPIVGVTIASLPIVFCMYMAKILIEGDLWLGLEPLEGQTYFLLNNLPIHYMIRKVDPNVIDDARNGRLGFAFVIIASFLIFFGALLFLPKRVSKREKEIELKRDKQASKESVWVPTLWKRSNFAYASFMIVFLNLCMVEVSLWEDFGTNIWYILIYFRPIGVILDSVTELILKEALLCTPVSGSFWLVADMVTLGADDFQDFVMGFMIDFALMLIERTYLDPLIGFFIDLCSEAIENAQDWIRQKMKVRGKSHSE